MLVGQDVLNRTAPPGIGLLGSIKIGASRGDAVAANGSDSSADKRLPAFGRRQRAKSCVMGVGDRVPRIRRVRSTFRRLGATPASIASENRAHDNCPGAAA